MADKLTRKGIQIGLDTHKELWTRKGEKEKNLAGAGHPREVTLDEIIRDAMGLK